MESVSRFGVWLNLVYGVLLICIEGRMKKLVMRELSMESENGWLLLHGVVVVVVSFRGS